MKSLYDRIMGDPLYKNSIFLMLSTGVIAVLGFIAWLVCARLFSAHDVGLATTILSVMSIITSFSLLGLNAGLIRYLPNSKIKNNKINTCFTLVALVTIIISSFFLIGLEKFSPSLLFIKDNLFLALSFIFFMIIASWTSLIESVFISFRASHFVLTKNSILGILRIVLPFALVSWGAYGIFSSYMIAMLAGFVTVFIILIVKFQYKPKFVFYDEVIKRMGRFSFGNYVAGFIGGLALLLLPLIITNTINPTTTAYYFVAIQIANLLFVIPSATTRSLFAEGSHDERQLKKKTISSIKIIAFLLIPAILAIVFFGQYVLLAFGKEYSSQGFTFLKIMAVSGIFVSINSVFGTVFNVKKKIGAIIIVNIIGAVVILGLSYYLIHKGDALIGIGIAWIAGQVAMNLAYWGMNGRRR
jgi:O-antigen/teichoic acid export membrane protein